MIGNFPRALWQLTLRETSRTGATGYIGGEALYNIASNARYRISCLIRDSVKGSMVKDRYPEVRIVQGDLDDAELIEHESKNADIVLSKIP